MPPAGGELQVKNGLPNRAPDPGFIMLAILAILAMLAMRVRSDA